MIEKKYFIAHRLKEIREKRGLKQKPFAERIGVSQQWISRLEKRGGGVGVSVVLNVCREFGEDFQELTSSKGLHYKDVAGIVEELPAPFITVREQLAREVKLLAMDKGVDDQTIEALLRIVRDIAPKKKED